MKSSFFFLFILALLVLSNSGFGQSFQISHVPAASFSLDKFTNSIYYASFTNLFVKSLEDSSVKLCPFPSLPIFANKSHKCVYGDEDSIFVYDFQTHTTIKICESVGGPYGELDYEFSPNDEYVLFREHYYSFADSSLHLIDFTPDPYLQMEWVNETEILYRTLGDEDIVLFDILSNSVDTILYFNSNITYEAFAYNKKQNLLYYSPYQINYPKIHSYDLTTHLDSVVFDSEADTNDTCWMDLNNMQEMEWSPDSSRMAFFSYILEAGGTIYTYVPTEKRAYKYTVCGGEGYEYFMKWLNNDTIVYFNATLGYIYGLALDDPLAVDEPEGSPLPVTMELSQNYPNPFNPATTIDYQIPQQGFVSLKVYDVLGREVAVLVTEEKSAGRYTVNFVAPDLASGIYLYQLRVNDYVSSKKMLLLK